MLKRIDYDGVCIEYDLDKPPVFSHSYPLFQITGGKQEAPQNIPYFQRLLKLEYSAIQTREQKEAVSGLYSLMNMNYQINNGGINQYFFNGYHKDRRCTGDSIPHRDQLVQHIILGKIAQFLHSFEDFKSKFVPLMEIDFYFYDANVLHTPSEDDSQELIETYDYVLGFDNMYFDISPTIEWGIELYSQYVIKLLEVSGYGK